MHAQIQRCVFMYAGSAKAGPADTINKPPSIPHLIQAIWQSLAY
ncbi:hypothetical protein HNR01_005574 [Methylorubrum rhodesianum]|nr:hypothetical protein [Methylorubrum rhodesianum]